VQLLRNNGIEPEVVEYLKYPLSVNELKSIAQMLGLRPKDFIRKGEQDFKNLELKEKLEDDEVLFFSDGRFSKADGKADSSEGW
jgi:arsenate reductase